MCFVIDAKYVIVLIQDSKKSVKKHKIFKNEHLYIKFDTEMMRYTYYAHSIWTIFNYKYIFVLHESNSTTNFLVNRA
jgi:hypothetical protein